MHTTNTKNTILNEVVTTYAMQGYEKMSMRTLAKTVGVAPSVLYHHFENKEDLLKAMYNHANVYLGQARASLPQASSARERLEIIIDFQLQHAEFVVAVLKYYFAHREIFAKEHAALPPKATLHIEEVLEYGIAAGDYKKESIKDSKVIAHIINGFLLEYYPHLPTGNEKKELIAQIADFIEEAIKLDAPVKSNN